MQLQLYIRDDAGDPNLAVPAVLDEIASHKVTASVFVAWRA